MSIYEPKKPRRINAVSITVFLVISSLAYVLYWWIPLWWPIVQLNQIMQGSCYDMYREFDNEAVMTKLITDSRRTGIRLTADNFIVQRFPYPPEEVQKMGGDTSSNSSDFLKRGKRCEIRMRYIVNSDLPFIDKKVMVTFDRRVEADLAQVKW